MKRRLMLGILGLLWAGSVCMGVGKILRYENTTGDQPTVSQGWPEESKVPRETGKYSLVLFAHPQCPCTRATIGELALLMAHSGGKMSAYVGFYTPKGFPRDWEKTDLWRSASAIPGVHVFSDGEGREARRFHARTSGQTLVYDPAGRMIFQGGITLARGHSGDNAGRSAIESLLSGSKPETGHTPVFGCSLVGETKTVTAATSTRQSHGGDNR